jgi:uracil-DNA glycosylase
MTETRSLVSAYLRQQRELGMPDFLFSQKPEILQKKHPHLAPVKTSARKDPVVSYSVAPTSAPILRMQPPAEAPKKNPLPLRAIPVAALHKQIEEPQTIPDGSDPVRTALIALYNKAQICTACGLDKTRTKVVFGSGDPHAALMVIGEAPGADEDREGLPFVGRAGELLTKMLSSINIDRQKNVFIANVLKCRPPENRTPATEEIQACSSILISQIDIIKPKVILFLGRIAAHALLSTADSISKLRTSVHEYKGIPSFVTYHPAALLRNDEYKRPAWEDLQKVQKFLTDNGLYAAQTTR